jgi:Flp pilus assembly protein TadD
MQLQPDLAQAYASRGIARSNLGDEEGAIADLQTAARLFQNKESLTWRNRF